MTYTLKGVFLTKGSLRSRDFELVLFKVLNALENKKRSSYYRTSLWVIYYCFIIAGLNGSKGIQNNRPLLLILRKYH